MKAIETLSIDLTSTTEQISQRQQTEKNQQLANKVRQAAVGSYLEVICGYFQWSNQDKKALIGGGGSFLGFHGSISPFITYGLESRIGYFSYEFYVSGSPILGLIFPFNEKIKILGDAILEIGYFGSNTSSTGIKGIIAEWLTPGYPLGILFELGPGIGVDLKYRGTWYEGWDDVYYTHSISLGLFWDIWD